MRAAHAIGLCVVLTTLAPAIKARAEGPPAFVTADRVVVRYFSQETGGAARPFFVTERMLSFEARLVSLADEHTLDFQDRHLRGALDLHVARVMLSKLPLAAEPDVTTMQRVASQLREALTERIGGPAKLNEAAAKEGISAAEVESLFRADARAAIYIDRAISPVLRPSENQLREVFHTGAHPFRDRRYESAKDDFARWFIADRVRAAQAAFAQTSRARVVLSYLSREP